MSEGRLRVGRFVIRRMEPGSVWIENAEGEGGQFRDEQFEAAVEEFFDRNF